MLRLELSLLAQYVCDYQWTIVSFCVVQACDSENGIFKIDNSRKVTFKNVKDTLISCQGIPTTYKSSIIDFRKSLTVLTPPHKRNKEYGLMQIDSLPDPFVEITMDQDPGMQDREMMMELAVN